MTHTDTESTSHRPNRNLATAGTALRRPARRPAASRPSFKSAQMSKACLVAALAEEAAAVLRLNRSLRCERADHDAELVEALEGPDDYVRPGEMTEALFDRLHAIADLASHRRAQSMKGVLFQLYLAGSGSQNPAGLLRTTLGAGDARALEENDRKVSRLHHGAIAHLEELVLDDDLIEVRNWYFTPKYDVHHTCERAIQARDGLVAEARALAADDAARRGPE